jgi:hypothetical protein
MVTVFAPSLTVPVAETGLTMLNTVIALADTSTDVFIGISTIPFTGTVTVTVPVPARTFPGV